jgi:hypothetical protein
LAFLTLSPCARLGPYEIIADSQVMPWIGRDAIFNSIRSEPRFIALLTKIGRDR